MISTAISVYSRSGSARTSIRRVKGAKERRSLFETPGLWMEMLERRMLMTATAATVALDPGFGQAGYAQPTSLSTGGWLRGNYSFVTPAGDGKLYAIQENAFDGWAVGYESFDLLRLNGDGSLDATFGNGGVVHVQHMDPGTPYYRYWSESTPELYTGPDSVNVGSLIVQPDGKILLAASATPPGSPDPFLLMRFNTDGSSDTSFGQAGTVELPVMDNNWESPHIALRPDGKIELLDIGAGSNDDHTVTLQMRQFNADGSPDSTVGTNGEQVTNLATGFVAEFEAAEPALQKLWATCGEDNLAAYSPDSWNTFDSLIALPDGTSIASFTSSFTTSVNGNSFGGMVEEVHFDATGDVVMNADIHPGTVNGNVGVAAQPDGKVVMLDTSDDSPTAGQITRYQLDGTPDLTFGKHGIVNTSNDAFKALRVKAAADGTLLVTEGTTRTWYFGQTEQLPTGLQRLNGNGTPDASFAGGQAVFGFTPGLIVEDATAMPDGSIITTLMPLDWAGTSSPFAKILPSGGASSTFDPHSLDIFIPDPNPTPPVTTDPGSDPSAADPSANDPTTASAEPTDSMNAASNTADAGIDPSIYYRLTAAGQTDAEQQQGFFSDDGGSVL